MCENYDLISRLANDDVAVLKEKGKSYGNSWRKRGGVGAFMMLARKWDRIEKQCEEKGYDIFDVLSGAAGRMDESFADDIADLRRYLLLVEGHVRTEVGRSGRLRPAMPAPDDLKGPWIKWEGGPCPVPHGALVEVVLRDGSERYGTAGPFQWERQNKPLLGDIMKYRVVG